MRGGAISVERLSHFELLNLSTVSRSISLKKQSLYSLVTTFLGESESFFPQKTLYNSSFSVTTTSKLDQDL